MGSCNPPASCFLHPAKRPVVSLTTWNTDRTNSALVVCISVFELWKQLLSLRTVLITTSLIMVMYVASTSTSAVKGWTKNLLNEVAEWVGTDSLEVFSAFYAQIFSGKVFWAPVFRGRVQRGNSNQKQMKTEREITWENLSHVSLWDLMGCTQRWWAGCVIVMPVLVIFEKSQRCWDISDKLTKANVALVFNISPKGNPGIYRLGSLTSVLGTVVGQVLLVHLSGHVKQCDWEQSAWIYQR